MRNVFIVLIAVLAASVALADGPTVAYKYVDAQGTLSFTDDEKRVPAKYKASAEKVALGELGDYGRFTPNAPIPPATENLRLKTLRAAQATPVATKQDCGTVTQRSERRDGKTNAGGDNTRYFIVEDDCGVLYDSPLYPEFIVRR